MYRLPLTVALFAGTPAAPAYTVPTHDECARRAAASSAEESARCWHDAAELALEPAQVSIEQLAALAAAPGAPFGVRFAHANLLQLRGDPEGLPGLRTLLAAAETPSQRLRVAARVAVALLKVDDIDAAAAVVDARATDRKAPVAMPVRVAFDIAAARLQLHRMRPEAAWRTAQSLRSLPGLSYRNRREVLLLLTAAGHDTGRLDAAYDAVTRLRKLANRVGDRAALGRTYFLELSTLSNSAELRRKVGRATIRARAREALAFTRGWNPTAHTLMGCLVGPTLGAEGEALLRDCVRFHRERGLFEHQNVESLSALALMRIEKDPAEAFALSDEALAIVRKAGHPTPHTIVAFHRAWMHWRVGEREQGFVFAEEAISALERLRDKQQSEAARARAQAFWGAPYHHMLTSLLLDRAPAGQTDIDRALDVIARLRGAALLSTLRETAIAGPKSAVPRADLAALQSSLSPEEALVIYQLTRPDDSITWIDPSVELPSVVLVVHRQGSAVLRLGNGPALDARVRTAADLIRRGVAPESVSSALWAELVAPVLAQLPDRVNKLVLVPDGSMWHLPFEALREVAGTPRLVERFALSVSPSPSVWLALRRRARPGAGGILAFADPPLPDDLDLAPLPGARSEVSSSLEAAGAGLALFGDDASESRLRSGSLGDYAVIHFAVHALADATAPERSYVLLAADGEHDGAVHPADIAGLELDNALVVLSACSAASGEVVAGEGVLGLARAFLQAGARAVVATAAPIRDRDAMLLFTRIHANLAAGHRVDEAVALAQRSRIADGAPVEAWSVMVVGDGSFRLPGRHDRRWARMGLALAAAVLLALALRLYAGPRKR